MGYILVIVISVWARQVRNYSLTASRGKRYFLSTVLSRSAHPASSLDMRGFFLGVK